MDHWIKPHTFSFEDEIEKFKALLVHIDKVETKYYKQYFIPDTVIDNSIFVPTLKDFMSKANMPKNLEKWLQIHSNSSTIYANSSEADLRIEYIAFTRKLIFDLTHSFLLLKSQISEQGRTRFAEVFGEIYNLDEYFFTNAIENGVENLINNYLFRSFTIWEYTLRGLVKFATVHQRQEIKQVHKDGHVMDGKPLLEYYKDGPILWRSFARYLGLDSPEYNNLVELSSEIRATSHNFNIYLPPGKNPQDKQIEYKGNVYNLEVDKVINFLSLDFLRLLLKDNFDLMIKVFESKNVKQYRQIPGRFKREWFLGFDLNFKYLR